MPIQPVTDIFFDLDHTLWDFERNSALAFDALFTEHAMEIDREAFLHHYVPINLRYWEQYRRDLIPRETLRYGRFREAFEAIGYSVDDATIDRVSDGYITHLPRFNHLFDGARETLDYLSAKYRLHIITNGFAKVQAEKIANASIGNYFTTVTDSERAGVKKPHRDIFAHALEFAGTSASQSLMVGDCIDADVRGAIDAGLQAIWFCPDPHENVQDILTIRHLSEIKSYL